MTLGEWLDKRGIGQAAFAERIGFSQGQVSRLVTGKRGRRISAALASAVERATDGAVPASSWPRPSKRPIRRGPGRSSKRLPNAA